MEALDAATGRTVKTYQGSEDAREIVCANGVLYLVLGAVEKQQAAEKLPSPSGRGAGGEGDLPSTPVPPLRDRILALDAATGDRLWSLEATIASTSWRRPWPLPAAGHISRTARRSSALTPAAARCNGGPRGPRRAAFPWSPPTLVVVDDVVLSADPTRPGPARRSRRGEAGYRNHVQTNAGELVALSAKTGQPLWKARCYPNFMSAVDVLVADGVVWTGQLWSVVNHGRHHRPRSAHRQDRPPPRAGQSGRHRRQPPSLSPHPRHRPLPGAQPGRHRTAGHQERGNGIQPLDPRDVPAWPGALQRPDLRPAPFLRVLRRGDVPRLRGHGRSGGRRPPRPAPRWKRARPMQGTDSLAPLRQGSAALLDDPDAWPTYRHDAARSGATATPVATALERAWQCNLGGRLSAPTAADGMVFCRPTSTRTRSMPWTPDRAARGGPIRPAAASIRRPRSAAAARCSVPPTAGSTVCGPAMAN